MSDWASGRKGAASRGGDHQSEWTSQANARKKPPQQKKGEEGGGRIRRQDRSTSKDNNKQHEENKKKKEEQLTSEGDATDELIASDVVKVHNADVEWTFADLFPRHVEGERLIEDWLEGALVDGRLAFLHPFVAKVQPHFDVRI